jgi:hypothetical protein
VPSLWTTMIFLRSGFASKHTDGHTPLICSNRHALQMNMMPFDTDGVCTIQGDGIPHPADMRSTIQIIERILLPHAQSAARCCTITDYRNCQARSVRLLACLGYCVQRYGNTTLLVRTATDRPYLRRFYLI